LVALNIKNPAAEKLAREVARQTGESLTEAVRRSLEERLERLKDPQPAPDLVETLLAIGRRCSSLPDLDTRDADEILGHDEHGAFLR
jgi:antitoxin VapB